MWTHPPQRHRVPIKQAVLQIKALDSFHVYLKYVGTVCCHNRNMVAGQKPDTCRRYIRKDNVTRLYGAPATDFRDYLPDMAASRIQRPCHLVSSSLYQEFPSAFLRRDEPAEHTAAIEKPLPGSMAIRGPSNPFESVRRHHRQSKCHLIIISRHESGSNTPCRACISLRLWMEAPQTEYRNQARKRIAAPYYRRVGNLVPESVRDVSIRRDY